MRCYSKAFTLIEILAVIALIAILATLFFPVAKSLMPRVERVLCINRLRNLHTVFAAYATEGWPQLPSGITLGSMEEQQWWVEKTKEDGLSLKHWQCPTINRAMMSLSESERPLIHYLPTPFSAEPNRANKGSRMPWLIEIANAHGRGNHIAFQDGTIKASNE